MRITEKKNLATFKYKIDVIIIMRPLSSICAFKTCFLVLSTLFVFGCSANKATHAGSDSLVTKKTTAAISENEGFDIFFKKFQSDSVFQVSRVSFPLKNTTIDEEDKRSTEFLNKERWGYTSIISGKADKEILKKKKISAAEYVVQCRVEDTGVGIDYHFVNKNGEWRLTYIEDYSD